MAEEESQDLPKAIDNAVNLYRKVEAYHVKCHNIGINRIESNAVLQTVAWMVGHGGEPDPSWLDMNAVLDHAWEVALDLKSTRRL